MISLIFALITIVGIAAGASGGGGGGGGSGGGASNSSTTPDPTPTFVFPHANSFLVDNSTDDPNWIITQNEADVYRTTEYNNQWGLEAIHAAEAYAALDKNGKTFAGNGIKIAITDTGARTTHTDLSANISAADNHNYINNNTNVNDADGHGSNVASIAAGVAGNGGMHGVAFDSQIVVAKSIPGFASDGAEAIYESASITGVKVINASWKYDSYSAFDGSSGSENSNDDLILLALAQAKEKEVLVVAATGNNGDNYNDGQDDVDLNYITHPKPAKLALFANSTDLAGYVLAVGAVDEEGRIADFSNICGVAKNHCLVAPGVNILGAYNLSNFSYAEYTGTSQATPHVSGAAAVISAAWPHLKPNQISQILLSSASDFGDAGADNIYGKGMLNLYAATQIQGSDSLAFGASVDSGGYSISDSSLISDPIFGDSLNLNLAPALKDAVVFDDYGRDYKAFLGNKITSKSNSYNLANLNNILLNNYKTKNIPFNFNQSNTKINLQIRSYSQNKLKFLTIDNSTKDSNLENQNGFSFTQNLSENSTLGFAFNIDEIKNFDHGALNKFNFISTSSLNSNPYQSFITNASSYSGNQKNFNQFFISHQISSKLKLNLSYQNSYRNNSPIAQNKNRENQISNFNFNFTPNKNTNFAISFGNVDEFNNNLLNSKALGAFESSGDVKTSFVKLSSSKRLFKNVFFIASLAQGSTKANGNNEGIFRNFSDIKSRSQSIGLVSEESFGGRFGVIYNEPLRVYKGKATIDIPIARDITGNLTRYRDEISLKPQGKERDLEIFYAKNLSNFSQISFNLLSIKDAGNVKSDKEKYVTMMNYYLSF